MADPSRGPLRQTYSLLLPVYVPTLLLSIGQGILVPTLPLYAQDFGVNYALVSLAVAAAGLGTLVGDVPTGMMLERFGRKPVMVVGTISLSLATLGLVFLQHFPALVALRFLAGVGTAMWNISRMAYLADTVPIRDRGQGPLHVRGSEPHRDLRGARPGGPGGHAAGPRRPVLRLRHRVGSGGR